MKRSHVVAAVVALIAVLCSTAGCLKYTSNILQYAVTTEPGASQTHGYNEYYNPSTTGYPAAEVTTGQSVEITTIPSNVATTEPTTGAQQVATTAAPAENVTAEAQRDASTWTTGEIVTYLNNAVSKTKGYTAPITVAHKESTEATVTDCPGGGLVKNLINGIVSGALDDSNETLNFSGGKAVSGEGETLQLLLPKAAAFNLTTAGVAAASASESGTTVTIKIQLVPETGSLSAPPPVHAATMGYLDSNSLDLSSVTISAFDTTYPGSTMEFTVDSTTGYVKSAVYTINVDISATGKALGMTGTVKVTAKQVETWNINW